TLSVFMEDFSSRGVCALIRAPDDALYFVTISVISVPSLDVIAIRFYLCDKYINDTVQDRLETPGTENRGVSNETS
ncbi:hypothetical protein Q8G50_34530, partial [Klebsiella pneumoniae]